ncbi:MAG: winged helix-turn-helix domain-containing protein, partial [Terriglobia bacterium]
MIENNRGTRVFRFGLFELDLQARELRRRGQRIKLQDKPFQILELLLERAGELVMRKDLREKLWPDTFVGFDRSLNTAVNSLRRALGDSPLIPRFVETRSRAGYRFVGPVEVITGSFDHSQSVESLHSIAVLPFHNASGDPETEYVSDGISDALINSLSQLPEVRVMARSSVFRYKNKQVDPQTVGHDLNVRALLTGKVALRDGTLTIGAELVDAAKGWRLWGEQYNRKSSDLLGIQEEISREIAGKLRLRLTAEARMRLQKRHTANPEAYQNYLRGRYHWNKLTEDGIYKAIGFFEMAVEQDSRFALPHAGLSDCHSLLAFFGTHAAKSVMPKAEQAARKAIELDDSLADAHASLAGILKYFHWDWAGAEAEYKQALE